MKKYEDDLDKKIEEFDKKTIHLLWTVFLSMITAIITVILSTR